MFLSGNILFFGCRNRDKDFLCKEEWESAVNKGYLELYTAFSRDQVRIRLQDQEANLYRLKSKIVNCLNIS